MSDQPFPPVDAAAFLGLCAGEWMSLRSSFELSSGGDDDWHSSERGELVVRSGEAVDEAEGELVVTASVEGLGEQQVIISTVAVDDIY